MYSGDATGAKTNKVKLREQASLSYQVGQQYMPNSFVLCRPVPRCLGHVFDGTPMQGELPEVDSSKLDDEQPTLATDRSYSNCKRAA